MSSLYQLTLVLSCITKSHRTSKRFFVGGLEFVDFYWSGAIADLICYLTPASLGPVVASFDHQDWKCKCVEPVPVTRAFGNQR